MASENDIRSLIARVGKLEQAVFSTAKQDVQSNSFQGAAGGIRLLVDMGFLNSKRSFAEIKSELQKNEYHYRKQAVQNALTRQSRAGGQLVSLNEKGKKYYAKRK